MNLRRYIVLAALCLLPMAPAQAFNVEPVVSPQGVEAWLVQDHSNPIISLSVAFRGGSATDPVGKTGLAYMTASLLDEGAGDMDSQTFQGKLEDLAISLGFTAGEDAFRGHLKTTSHNRDAAFDMFRQSLTQPRFDADAVERIRGQILSELTRELQDPDAIAGRAFAKMLYPDHPYGLAVDGVPDTIKAISIADLKAYGPQHLGRDVMYVSVVGDISPEELGPLLDSTFAGLPATSAPIAVAEAAPDATGKVEVIHRAIPQSVVEFGEAGLKRADPDWYAAYVMNYVLGGGGFSSRLMTEVRVKRGLAYGVYSYLLPRDHSAMIGGGVATRNDRVAESLQLIRSEWAHMAEGGVSAKELADAKTYLTGSFPLQMDSTEAIASLMITIQMDHLGIDYLDRRNGLINGVSLDDVKRVARRLLDPQKLTAIVVGDPQGL
ncbi:MAG TPA: pitrilysin family protein [Patescibacteria group bacterium]|nr:pitrilysin family protein [Patescibacteria group bacterium]